MKKILNSPLLLFVTLVIGLAIGSSLGGKDSATNDLQAKGEKGSSSHDHSGESADEIWTCSMHPQIQSPDPGSCPICGMDLIKASTGTSANSIQPDEVKLSARALALAQIQTTRVRTLSGTAAERTLIGRIAKNEDQTKVITAWFGGRIEKLRVSSVGEVVKRYQTIAYLYSPAIYAAHRDLMTAQTQVGKLSGAEDFAKSASLSALESAKMRLRLLGLRNGEIEKMSRAKKAWTRVPIRSPFAGTVVNKRVSEGEYVKEGQPLLEISDLDTIWVELDAYAADLPLISVGQRVSFTVDSIPEEIYEGKVSFIEPFVDSATRTGTVRVELKNDGKLKPGQYVSAKLEGASNASAALVIPRSAPLYAGKRSVVYIEKQLKPDPVYRAKTIKLGQIIGDQVIVVSGLEEGQRVVTHGAFALDADLQIRGGLSLLARPDDKSEISALDIPAGFLSQVSPEVEAYLEVQQALASDDVLGAQNSARQVQQQISTVSTTMLSPRVRKKWDQYQGRLSEAASKIAMSENVENARTHFEGLSLAVADILKAVGNPLDTPVSYTFCPMAFDSKGAHWLQLGTEIKNAYYGEKMLSCGSVEEVIQPSQRLGAPSTMSESGKSEVKAEKEKPSKRKSAKTKKGKSKQSKPKSPPSTQAESKPGSKPHNAPTSSPTSGVSK